MNRLSHMFAVAARSAPRASNPLVRSLQTHTGRLPPPQMATTHWQSRRNFLTFVNQYQKGVTFTFGKLTSVKNPGLRIAIPILQDVQKVDMRTRVYELPKQDVMTKDNVACAVSAVVYYRVTDAEAAVISVEDVDVAVRQLAQTELRDLLCKESFNQMLEQRSLLSANLQKSVASYAEQWGVCVERVQMKNVDLVEQAMVRAMAKEAEATRERTAAIIRADGELQAALKLTEASSVLSEGAMELRRLQMMEKISKEKSQHTVIVPMEMGGRGHSAAMMGLSAAGARIPVMDEPREHVERKKVATA